MIKNLFGKLMISYVVVVSITVILLLSILSYIFQDFYTQEKEKRLLTAGQEIIKIVKETEKGNLTYTILKEQLVDYEHRFNADIAYFKLAKNEEVGSKLFQSHLVKDYFTKDQIEKIMQGEIITSISKYNEDRVLSVALPILSGPKVTGGVSLHSTMYDVTNASKQIFRLSLIAGGIAICLIVPFSWVISRRIAHPLQEMSEQTIKLAAGQFTPVPVYSDDEIGQLAKSFNIMVQELSKIEKMRKDFVANVSHELRTPLTFISGVLQTLVDQPTNPEEAQHYLRLAINETERMGRLITELLNLANLEAGNFSLKITTFDLRELIMQSITKMEPLLEKKKLSLELNIGEQKLYVQGDRDRIQQVLLNLMDNAITYTPLGGKIKISLVNEEQSAIVMVSDTGVGIPEEDLAHIWERFYKVDKARGREEQGTGLGLAIVRHLIRAHGGEVGVTSKVGQGSSFWFSLKI